MSNHIDKEISLDKLKILFELSVRTVNVCRRYGLDTSEKILSFYFSNGKNFTKLNNCGRKSSLELQLLCKKLLEDGAIYSTSVLNEEEQINVNLLEELNLVQLNELTDIFLFGLSTLSKRSENGLNPIFKSCDRSLTKLLIYLENIDYDFAKIKGLGSKSKSELKPFFDQIKSHIRYYKKSSNNRLSSLGIASRIAIYLNLSIQSRQKIVTYLDSSDLNDFPLFHFLTFLTENQFLLDERATFILRYYSGYYNNEKLKLEQIAKSFGISRERVRQISKYETLHQPFWNSINKIISIFPPSLLDRYDIDPNVDLIVLNYEDINELDEVNYTETFMYNVFFKILSSTHVPIMDEVHGYYPKYLVNRQVLTKVDIVGLIKDTAEIITSKVEKDFQLNLKGFLYSYQREIFNADQIREICFLIEKILFEEFELLTDLEGNITIYRNVKKKTYEYVVEVLEEANKPLHLDEIYHRLKNKYPKFKSPKSSISSQAISHRNIFVITSWSTYGLKIWEDQGRILGGSIKDIVETYLEKFEEPKHIYEIAQFVVKHRDTNKKNIFSNLQSDPHNRFSLFGYGFVGLTSKIYKQKDIQFNGIPNVAMRFLERDYFESQKSKLNVIELAEEFAKINNIKTVQVLSSIEDKIREGKYEVIDNFLHIKNI